MLKVYDPWAWLLRDLLQYVSSNCITMYASVCVFAYVCMCVYFVWMRLSFKDIVMFGGGADAV